MTRKRRITLSVNAAWNIVNFRAGLVHGLQNSGFDVSVIAPDDGYGSQLRDLGIDFHPITLDRKGRNPAKEILLLRQYRAILGQLRPDAYLGFTIKPNIYGSIACKSLQIPVINNIAGLGTAFAQHDLLSSVVRILYRHALKNSRRVFFQNLDDQQLFVQAGIVSTDQSRRLPGSGVDLERFAQVPLPAGAGGKVTFLLSARLLWDKGIGDYVEAARLLQQRNVAAEFRILGLLDEGNPKAIPAKQLQDWHDSGAIRYLGSAKDVRPVLAQADCIVLPSIYREGVPRALLEAGSMGRPLITTDWIGCRDAVDAGHTGYLVPPSNAQALAQCMQDFTALDPAVRQTMGDASRAKMQTEFDEHIVINRYLDELRTIC